MDGNVDMYVNPKLFRLVFFKLKNNVFLIRQSTSITKQIESTREYKQAKKKVDSSHDPTLNHI